MLHVTGGERKSKMGGAPSRRRRDEEVKSFCSNSFLKTFQTFRREEIQARMDKILRTIRSHLGDSFS